MADSKGNVDGPKATPALIALAERVRTMTKVAKEDNKNRRELYETAMRYIYADQLHNIVTKKGWERIQVNYVKPAQDQIIALVSQQRTKIIATPFEDGDRAGTEIWGGKLQWEYEEGCKISRKRGDWLQDGNAHGFYASLVEWDEKPDGGWDAEKEKWNGKLTVEVLRPEWVGVDPTAESVDIEHAEFVLVEKPVSVDWAKDKWSDAKEEIERSAGVEREYEQTGDSHGIVVTKTQEAAAAKGTSYKTGHRDAGTDVGAGEGVLADLLLKKPEDKFYRKDGGDKAAKVTLLRIWFKDRTMEKVTRDRKRPIAETDVDGTTTVDEATGYRVMTATGERFDGTEVTEEYEVEKPKYPYGRYIEMVGNVVLNPKEEDQVWEYDEWPVKVGKYGMLPHVWWGLNGVEMVRTPQDYLNISYIYTLTNTKFFGMPAWLIEDGAVVIDKGKTLADAIRSAPGAIIKLIKGAKQRGAVERLPPPAMNQAALTNIGMLREEVRQQTSVQEPMQGIAGKAKTATEAIRLETNSRIIHAMRLLLLDGFTLDNVKYMFKVLKRHVKVDDLVRIMGEQNRAKIVQFMSEGDFQAKFDLTLEMGTALPADEDKKKNEALTLSNLVGPAFLSRLLEAFNVRDPEELLQGNEIAQVLAMLDELDPQLKQEMMQEFMQAVQKAMADVSATQQQNQGGAAPAQETPMGAPQGALSPAESGAPPNATEATMAGMGMPQESQMPGVMSRV